MTREEIAKLDDEQIEDMLKEIMEEMCDEETFRTTWRMT